MPISPQQVKAARQGDLEEVIKELDIRLLEHGQKGTDFPVCTCVPKGFKTWMRPEIISRYGAVGWRVEFVSDQRDGDFLRFNV